MSFDFEGEAKKLYYAYSEAEIVEALKRAFQEGAAMEADKLLKPHLVRSAALEQDVGKIANEVTHP